MKPDWAIPLSERPDWHLNENGHWQHISYGKKTKQSLFSFIKIGRNAPCPCESGLKYKKCCMK